MIKSSKQYFKLIKNQIFLSVVIVYENDMLDLEDSIRNILKIIDNKVDNFEIVIVNNNVRSNNHFEKLINSNTLKNIQIYSLASKVDELTARWAGIENSIGDLVICLDPNIDNMKIIPKLIELGFKDKYDIVFTNQYINHKNNIFSKIVIYNMSEFFINLITGIDLKHHSTSFIMINRSVINYLSQLNEPHIKFRLIQSLPGFSRYHLKVYPLNHIKRKISLRKSFIRGIRLITSHSGNPLRIASLIASIGGAFCFLYSLYVLFIWLSKDDIAPGWVSISLIFSIMFFLFSIVLTIYSEYLLEFLNKNNGMPPYFITKEYSSRNYPIEEKLNIFSDEDQ